ncbi:hypothetical protein [Synechococcus sp. CCY 9618]|uniref:hypothetical protein n=1 Tax=Synechococcus sp. CCY 9618 TaxID=2815602 RepID=UPI001C243741|nr:hypothetical protein [Synechococcus sp. CCY 9618]
MTCNCPLPAGTSGSQLLAAWRQQLLPLAEAFAPEFVLVSTLEGSYGPAGLVSAAAAHRAALMVVSQLG